MGTRVTCAGNAWYVKESVADIKLLCEPHYEPIETNDVFTTKGRYTMPGRFLDLTPSRSTQPGPITIAVANIIALEPGHD